MYIDLTYFIKFLLVSLLLQSNIYNIHSTNVDNKNKKSEIIVGANQISEYINYLKNKKIAVVANHTLSLIHI